VKADCFRFRVNVSVALGRFIAFQLNVSAAVDAGRMANGTTRSRIPLSQMGERNIALPPLAEQQAISAHLSDALHAFDTLTTTAESAIALLQERRAALVSAAVTGKIDVRHLAPQETEAA
jgi:type I restriction enzyme, S subunit